MFHCRGEVRFVSKHVECIAFMKNAFAQESLYDSRSQTKMYFALLQKVQTVLSSHIFYNHHGFSQHFRYGFSVYMSTRLEAFQFVCVLLNFVLLVVSALFDSTTCFLSSKGFFLLFSFTFTKNEWTRKRIHKYIEW